MNKPRLVTLDISSKKTGAALNVSGSLSDYKLLDYSSISDSEERMKEMARAITEILNEWQPNIIYAEDTWMANNPKISKMLTLLLGVAYAWAVMNNCSWNVILPSRWRKLAGWDLGKKKREELKQMSIDYVFENYGITCNDDVADAISISAAVFNYYNTLQIIE